MGVVSKLTSDARGMHSDSMVVQATKSESFKSACVSWRPSAIPPPGGIPLDSLTLGVRDVRNNQNSSNFGYRSVRLLSPNA